MLKVSILYLLVLSVLFMTSCDTGISATSSDMPEPTFLKQDDGMTLVDIDSLENPGESINYDGVTTITLQTSDCTAIYDLQLIGNDLSEFPSAKMESPAVQISDRIVHDDDIAQLILIPAVDEENERLEIVVIIDKEWSEVVPGTTRIITGTGLHVAGSDIVQLDDLDRASADQGAVYYSGFPINVDDRHDYCSGPVNMLITNLVGEPRSVYSRSNALNVDVGEVTVRIVKRQ